MEGGHLQSLLLHVFIALVEGGHPQSLILHVFVWWQWYSRNTVILITCITLSSCEVVNFVYRTQQDTSDKTTTTNNITVSKVQRKVTEDIALYYQPSQGIQETTICCVAHGFSEKINISQNVIRGDAVGYFNVYLGWFKWWVLVTFVMVGRSELQGDCSWCV